jgi:D-glycerate 3-kinase
MVEGPLDVVLVEGWMLGFTPVDPGTIADADLRAVNENLRAYRPWWDVLDAMIWLEPQDHRFVSTWRAEAEAKAIAEGRAGMTPAEVDKFVSTYLPCYPLYYPALRERAPVDGPYLRVRIGADRMPLDDQP